MTSLRVAESLFRKIADATAVRAQPGLFADEVAIGNRMCRCSNAQGTPIDGNELMVRLSRPLQVPTRERPWESDGQSRYRHRCA